MHEVVISQLLLLVLALLFALSLHICLFLRRPLPKDLAPPILIPLPAFTQLVSHHWLRVPTAMTQAQHAVARLVLVAGLLQRSKLLLLDPGVFPPTIPLVEASLALDELVSLLRVERRVINVND